MAGEIPAVLVNCRKAFYIVDRFPYVRLRSVLISPFTVTAQPGDDGDQIPVLCLALFWRLKGVTDICKWDVWASSMQMYVERISSSRIPMRRETHRIELKGSVTLREPR